jgi:ABC-type antimicrobial peptide transport system permease subunit
LLTLLASISVVLSAAGLAALMSFTVSERTREIGIRAALGAGPARIVSAVLTRAAAQLVVGAALGVPMAVALVEAMDAEFAMSLPWPVVYAGAALLVVIIGLLACARPTLRGLGIRPSEALRGS